MANWERARECFDAVYRRGGVPRLEANTGTTRTHSAHLPSARKRTAAYLHREFCQLAATCHLLPRIRDRVFDVTNTLLGPGVGPGRCIRRQDVAGRHDPCLVVHCRPGCLGNWRGLCIGGLGSFSCASVEGLVVVPLGCDTQLGLANCCTDIEYFRPIHATLSKLSYICHPIISLPSGSDFDLD